MKQKKRKLTAAEQARTEAFARTCAALEAQGYRRRDLTIGTLQANLLAPVVMLPFLALAAWGYYALHPAGGFWALVEDLPLYFAALALFLVLIVVHELIHGLVWGLCAESGFSSIRFGVIWSALTPYCTCSAPLRRGQYALGAAMPTLLLGFGLAGAAMALGSFFLFAVAELMILGGGGDALILLRLLSFRPKGTDVVYLDHPTDCGLVAFEQA